MTTTTTFDRVMQNARIALPGSLDAALQLELFNTLDEFFVESSFWKEDIDFPVTNTETEYLISPDSGAQSRIVRLEKLINSDGISVQATMQEPATIVLNSQPTAADTLTATVILTVLGTDRDGYPVVPRWIIDRYYQGIVSGLISKMMMQAAKPYTNERLGIVHARKFAGAIAKARVDALHQNLQRGQNWKFPSDFAKSQRLKW